MKYEKIDICQALSIGKKFPMVNQVIEGYKESFKTLPHSCPVLPAHYEAKEVDTTALDANAGAVNQQVFKFSMKGIYKFMIQVFNNDDANIFFIEWEIDLKD